jgi:putative transposase
MSQSYRHTEASVFLLHYHFVWIPRRRRKVLTGEVAHRLEQLLYQQAETLDCTIITLEVRPDHVHCFLNATPELAPKQIMHRVKGATSRLLRKEFPLLRRMPSLWTRSYFVSTAGTVSSETVQRYISNQRKS